MEKVRLQFIDTRNVGLDDLIGQFLLSERDLEPLAKITNEETKKEAVASLYTKNKYAYGFHLNQFGKPISGNQFFNVSHSKGMVVIALADKDVGVDIELIRDYQPSMARYISNDDEFYYIVDNKTFYKVWTSKESLVKCIGTGINGKVNEIPAFPLNSVRHYMGETFISKIIEKDGFVISITLKGEEPFEVEEIQTGPFYAGFIVGN